MQVFDPNLSCRQGQVLVNLTITNTIDELVVKYCCDVKDISAVQTSGISWESAYQVINN